MATRDCYRVVIYQVDRDVQEETNAVMLICIITLCLKEQGKKNCRLLPKAMQKGRMVYKLEI